MKKRNIQFVPILIALVGVASAPVSYWCTYSNGMCYGTWVSHVYQYFTNPLYNFSLYFSPIALILIFVPRHIFVSWLKFALWALPLSFIFIVTTPVNWTGIGLDLFPFYRDDAARLAGQAFAVMSALLVVWKYIVARRTKSADA